MAYFRAREIQDFFVIPADLGARVGAALLAIYRHARARQHTRARISHASVGRSEFSGRDLLHDRRRESRRHTCLADFFPFVRGT